MAETLAEKARRLGIQPGGAAPVATTTPQETLAQKAARLGIAPAKPQAAPRQSTLGKVAKGFDTVFGGGKVGEYIGTKVGYALASDDEKKYYDQSTPTGKEILGSALKSASVLGGAVITGGTSVVGQALAGAGAGYAYDVGSDLEEGKSAKEVLTPGLGTVIGAAAPVAIRGAAIAGKPAIAAVARGAKNALPTTEKLVASRAKNFDTVFQSSGSPRNFYKRSGQKGYTVSETLAANDRYIPNVNGGKITPESSADAIANIKTDASRRARIIDEVIKTENKYVDLASWRQAAIKEIDHLKPTGDRYNRTLEKINKDFEAYSQMADAEGRVPLTFINDAKKTKYEYINWKDDDIYTADRAVARAAKGVVENNITDVDIKQLNYELGRLYDAQEGVETLAKAGATVPGGRLGRYAARGIGVALGSSGGPVSAILGGVTGDQLAALMQKSYLSGNPAFKAMIGEVAQKEPKVFDDAMRILEKRKNRSDLMLPAPSSIRMGGETTKQTGMRTFTDYDEWLRAQGVIRTPGQLALPAPGPASSGNAVNQGRPIRVLPPNRNIDVITPDELGTPNQIDRSQSLPSNQADTIPATTNAPTSPNTNTIPSTVPPPAGPSSTLPPGQAFAGLPAGFEKDENGEIKFNPVTAGLGAIGVAGATRAQNIRAAQTRVRELNGMIRYADDPKSRLLYVKMRDAINRYLNKLGQ